MGASICEVGSLVLEDRAKSALHTRVGSALFTVSSKEPLSLTASPWARATFQALVSIDLYHQQLFV